ncbi:MAG TPA: LuxR C-terminal-related transcriptional regulator [Gemmatimonadaceae bacterium]
MQTPTPRRSAEPRPGERRLDTGALRRGRRAFERRAWRDAFDLLSAADREAPLEPADLELLAASAHLTGRDDELPDLWSRAHHAWLRRSEPRRAARCASWLALTLLLGGEMARGGGWIARAQRLLDESPEDCVEHGHLLVPIALRAVIAGDFETARHTFASAAAIGDRFGDASLVALARQGQGRALIWVGEIARGVALLDEVMVAVTAGETDPVVAGAVYCSVIAACLEIFDLRRAREWTAALTEWCATQEQLGPYRGQCLVHRAEMMRFHGAWSDALTEAERARDWLLRPPAPAQRAAGAAHYQLAELHRLRGDFDRAEAAYRDASACGHEPQPGLAQLRLAQGRVDAARTAICRALGEARDRRSRARLLPAVVDVLLAAHDVDAARAAADELSRVAEELDAPFLRAASARAAGAVRLAEGDAGAALAELRRAFTEWSALDAPYDAARTRVLLARACRALGDHDGAALEMDAARVLFRELGATPDIAAAAERPNTTTPAAASGLTAREAEVLSLVAGGMTNKAIAAALGISEKTVARHVSNLFTKLGLSNRAAATAYAYRHGLVRPPAT